MEVIKLLEELANNAHFYLEANGVHKENIGYEEFFRQNNHDELVKYLLSQQLASDDIDLQFVSKDELFQASVIAAPTTICGIKNIAKE